ncbi:MAG: hypothetical protein ACJ78Q_08090 [Chloroflexia bacterium]
MILLEGTLLTLAHLARFGSFFGCFGCFNPFFVFLMVMILYVMLRKHNRWGNHRGGRYYRGGPYRPRPTWQAPPPPPPSQQPPTQTPGGYAAPHYGNPGNTPNTANVGGQGTPTTRVDVGANPGGGAETIRMDTPTGDSGEPTRRLGPMSDAAAGEPETPKGRIMRSEDDPRS